ncbi:MAG: transglutaminase-like domain-containing protein [Candidatus Paceibacterota bacterium]
MDSTNNGSLQVSNREIINSKITFKGKYQSSPFEVEFDLSDSDIRNYSVMRLRVSSKHLRQQRKYIWSYNKIYAIEEYLSRSERAKISKLSSSLQGGSLKDSAWNILKWEEQNIDYNYQKRAKSKHQVQKPGETIKKGDGICTDYAVLTAGLLLNMDYQPIYLFDIDYKSGGNGHSTVSIELKGDYYTIDQNPPVKNLGSFYQYWSQQREKTTQRPNKIIKKATVYGISVERGNTEASEVEELEAKDFRTNEHRVSESDLNRIRKTLANTLVKDFSLEHDMKLVNLDMKNQLPRKYRRGKYYSNLFYNWGGSYAPIFHNNYCDYIYESLFDGRDLNTILEKYKKFSFDVNKETDDLKVKLNLVR